MPNLRGSTLRATRPARDRERPPRGERRAGRRRARGCGAAGRGARAPRGRAGRRQDDAGARPRALAGLLVRAHPVHARPAAERRDRRQRLRPRTSDFAFRPGPVFANVVLADEINRATPRTQSALLEAMQERQVTLDGVAPTCRARSSCSRRRTRSSWTGTFPLPEAQLDRFLLRLSRSATPTACRGEHARRPDSARGLAARDARGRRGCGAWGGRRARLPHRARRRLGARLRRCAVRSDPGRCGWRSGRARARVSRWCASRGRMRSSAAATTCCPTTSRRSRPTCSPHRLLPAAGAPADVASVLAELLARVPVPLERGPRARRSPRAGGLRWDAASPLLFRAPVRDGRGGAARRVAGRPRCCWHESGWDARAVRTLRCAACRSSRTRARPCASRSSCARWRARAAAARRSVKREVVPSARCDRPRPAACACCAAATSSGRWHAACTSSARAVLVREDPFGLARRIDDTRGSHGADRGRARRSICPTVPRGRSRGGRARAAAAAQRRT